MIKRILLLVFIFNSASNFSAIAGDGTIATGARSSATGGASLTYHDLWSAFNNQAGLGKVKGFSAGVTNEFRFLVPELSVRGLAIALPVKNAGVFGVSISYFGYSVYNEKKIGLAYSRAFGDKVSAGLQIDYLSTHLAESYGDRHAFTAEAGIQVLLLKNLVIAAHVYNPTRTKLSDYDDERFPTTLKAGLSYTFSEKLIVSAESEKSICEHNIFKAGVEYHIVKPLYLRCGLSTNPGLYSFGFGLRIGKLEVDMASTYHQVLGFSPQVSLTYAFK